jgi:hypothetical protein
MHQVVLSLKVLELAPTSAIQLGHKLLGLPESLPLPQTVRLTGRRNRVEASAKEPYPMDRRSR